MQDNAVEIHTDVDEGFEREIGLWKLICQKPTLEILQRTVLCHQNNVSEGKSPKLPFILVSAEDRGLGAETASRSMCSSLSIPLKVGFGEAFRFPADIQAFFQDASDDTAFYISNSETMQANMQQLIYRIVKDKILRLAGHYGKMPQYVPFDNKLIILGTTSEISIVPALLYLFDLRISLTSYSHNMIVCIHKCNALFWYFLME